MKSQVEYFCVCVCAREQAITRDRTRILYSKKNWRNGKRRKRRRRRRWRGGREKNAFYGENAQQQQQKYEYMLKRHKYATYNFAILRYVCTQVRLFNREQINETRLHHGGSLSCSHSDGLATVSTCTVHCTQINKCCKCVWSYFCSFVFGVCLV